MCLNKKEVLRYKEGTKNEQNEPATTYHLVFEHEGWIHESAWIYCTRHWSGAGSAGVAASSGEHSSRSGTRGGVKHHIPGPAGFRRWLGGIQNRCLMDMKMQIQPCLRGSWPRLEHASLAKVRRQHIGARLLVCCHDGRRSESPGAGTDIIWNSYTINHRMVYLMIWTK